ncbi:hypothetical protein MesoLjLc_50150 [Mesorhizobium sp. L-8-10]|uniref:Sec-independent protein translocase protein TatB n=1 Tax=Mesorhizobium sp. L-8-10 TaxID=2744523 RepID=UPI001925181B|nr:Sec-independent protein translocase protein TatB [Mesorhizobium sp. L-8-10]BCH33085.1 hypothetical protein MesoLjLc_50150 [Mesorhizobium sp. L-8-10]
MFDIGWTEMLVIAVVMIVVVGPKDLPRMLRTFGKTTAKLRTMAGDFQKQFNEALKEAELDDVKKSVDSLRTLNPMAEIRKQLNPFEQAAADVKAGVDSALKPAQPAAADKAASTEAIGNGVADGHAAAAPTGPTEMPAEPVFPAMSAEPASPVTAPAAPLKAGPAALPAQAPAVEATAGEAAVPAGKTKETRQGQSGAKAPATKASAKTKPAAAAPAKGKPAAKAAATKKNTAGTAK